VSALTREFREYNTANAGLLATEIGNLRTFDQIAEWDKKATAEIEAMRSISGTVEGKLQNIALALAQEKQAHESKSFFARLFDGRNEQKRLLVEQARLTRERTQIENLIDQFEAAIDFTPNSMDDLKELIKECKRRKKELQTEKKAISTQMTSIRVEARQQTASTVSGKYGSWDRRQIRLNKEAALRPHETQKAAIERQIIKLDQIVIWLERFK
jgi:chromosome segregation ATPase